MRQLSRALILAVVGFTLTPALALSAWQESGWIGTCAGIGCTGRRAICAIYTYTASGGNVVKNYCYLDP